MRKEVNLAARIQTIIPLIPAPARNNVWQGILILFLCMVDGFGEVVLNDEADAYGWDSSGRSEISQITYILYRNGGSRTQNRDDSILSSAVY